MRKHQTIHHFLLILFCLLSFTALGQVNIGVSNQDTTKNKKKSKKEIVKIDPFYASYQGVEGAGLEYDSLLWDFKGMQNYSPLFQQYFNVQCLGDIGLPYQPYIVNLVKQPGFLSGWNLYDGYLYNYNNTPYLRSFVPFTRLQYVQTKKEYIHLQGLHSQNITPGWNIALRFQTINNMGFYPNQKNSLRQFGFSSRYMDLSNRYYAQLGVSYNRMRMQENGGWADEANFDSLKGVNKSAQVRLNNSSNLFGNREYFFEQVYWLSGLYIKTSDTTRYFKPTLGIKHQSVFGKTMNVFESQGEDLTQFAAIYHDSLQTHDSSAFVQQTHSIGITNYLTDTSKFHFYAGAGIEILKVHYLNVGKFRPGNNLYAEANFRWNIFKQLILQAESRSYFIGYNAGDIQLNGTLQYSFLGPQHRLKKKRLPMENIAAKITMQNRTPGYIYQHYEGNHVKWSKDFVKEQVMYFEGGMSGNLKIVDWRIKIANTSIANTVFLGYGATPEQYNGITNQTELWFTFKFKFGGFHFTTNTIVQQPSNLTTGEILPTPAISTYNSIFYQQSLFKKALKLQVGIDVRWYSQFYAKAYDPTTRLFYLQARRIQGNYPLLDAFVGAEVKTFRLFVKLEHANYELMDGSFPNLYYSTPGYSLPPRRVAFGLQWKFYQ